MTLIEEKIGLNNFILLFNYNGGFVTISPSIEVTDS